MGPWTQVHVFQAGSHNAATQMIYSHEKYPGDSAQGLSGLFAGMVV